MIGERLVHVRSAAVHMGGDTDTRCAIAGTLAGARWGDEAIAVRWVAGCPFTQQAIEIGAALTTLRARLDR